MKKIGILTFHRPINYGAVLQVFSLSEKMKKEFGECNVEIVDYVAPMEKRKIWVNVLREIKHHSIQGGYREFCKIRSFQKALGFLPLSKRKICSANLDELFEYINSNYDLLIIGSDAVFNWNQNGFPTAFIPNYKFNIPVMTYAASVHGLRYRQEPMERIRACCDAFGNMSYIGTRDQNTDNFVRYCNEEVIPQHNCDPTLFIDTTRIIELAGDCDARLRKKYRFSKGNPYIVVMLPDEKYTAAIYEKYHHQYTIVSTFKKSKNSDVFLYDLSPFEWAWLLKHASLVITSYFHGALLSLVQGTSVIATDYSGMNEPPYEGKLKDLMMKRFGLEEMYFDIKQDKRFSDNADVLLDRAEKLLDRDIRDRIDLAVSNERECVMSFIETCRRFV